MRTADSLPLLLLEIRETLRRLDNRIDDLVNTQYASPQRAEADALLPGKAEVDGMSSTDIYTLLSLPDHLRKTVIALRGRGEATAAEIAKETGRARAVESGYLNQLYTMRYVKKKRKGRSVHFSVHNCCLGN